MATWKELEAQGIKRCCAMYENRTTGKTRQCRRRANAAGSWCDPCARKIEPLVERYSDFGEDDQDDEDDQD